MPMTNDTIVLTRKASSSVYKLYPHRFYILFVFSFLSFNQNLFWFTFAPIARSAKAYYHIDDPTITLLLNWGPIIFIPFLPLAYILLNKQNGFRKCVILVALADFVVALLRLIPSIITTPSSPHFTTITMPFLHASQIINAVCGPLVSVPVSQLSCLWFSPNERTRATTIAIMANNFGPTIGFLISPAIVSSPEYVPRLLYVHMGLAFIACVLTVLYFPDHPSTPPSAAAELLILHPSGEESGNSWREYMKNIWTCFKTTPFVLLSTAGGLLMGTFGAWGGVMNLILAPENYTEQQAGWFGFAGSLAGIIGSIIISDLADRRRFQRSFKSFIIISFVCCLLSLIWFELSVHSLFYDKHIISSNAFTIGLSLGLIGLFQGAASPLIYEALAEIMFPLPESVSASILVQWISVVLLIFLFIAPNRYKLMNFLVLIVMCLSILLVSLTRFIYKRRDEDEKKQRQKVLEQTLDSVSLPLLEHGVISRTQYGAI